MGTTAWPGVIGTKGPVVTASVPIGTKSHAVVRSTACTAVLQNEYLMTDSKAQGPGLVIQSKSLTVIGFVEAIAKGWSSPISLLVFRMRNPMGAKMAERMRPE
jgi:hypothetical protein